MYCPGSIPGRCTPVCVSSFCPGARLPDGVVSVLLSARARFPDGVVFSFSHSVQNAQVCQCRTRPIVWPSRRRNRLLIAASELFGMCMCDVCDVCGGRHSPLMALDETALFSELPQEQGTGINRKGRACNLDCRSRDSVRAARHASTHARPAQGCRTPRGGPDLWKAPAPSSVTLTHAGTARCRVMGG